MNGIGILNGIWSLAIGFSPGSFNCYLGATVDTDLHQCGAPVKNCLAFTWWTSTSNFTMLCGTLKKRQERSIKFGLFEATFKSRPKRGPQKHFGDSSACDLGDLWPVHLFVTITRLTQGVLGMGFSAIRPNNFGAFKGVPFGLVGSCDSFKYM